MSKPSWLLLSILFLPLPAWAIDYRVDLIVTLNRDAPTDVAQTHGLPIQPSVFGSAVAISDAAALKRMGIALLPEKAFGLEKEWQKLRNSRFRPIMRLAWRVNERATATPIRLHDDLRYQVMPVAAGFDSPVTGITTPGYSRYRLDGKLLVQQSAGLRVTLDLEYTLPVTASPADSPSASSPLVFDAAQLAVLRLQAEKRVNPGQVHFFDHPLLGVLLRVSPAD
jgi:hypothetical protein